MMHMKHQNLSALLLFSWVLNPCTVWASPIKYTIVGQGNQHNVVFPSGMRLGLLEVKGTITTDGRIGGIGEENLVEWDVNLAVSESDFVEGGTLLVPLEPTILTRVIANADSLRISTSQLPPPPYGYLEFANGDSYWRVRANEFDQASIDFHAEGAGSTGIFSTPSGVFAIVVPEPSGNWVFGFGGLLMLAKRRKR